MRIVWRWTAGMQKLKKPGGWNMKPGKPPSPPYQRLFNKWLAGTTCNIPNIKSVYWLSDCQRYVVFRHASHSSYIDRCSGVQTCRARYVLVDCETQDNPDWSERVQFVSQIEGRYDAASLFGDLVIPGARVKGEKQ